MNAKSGKKVEGSKSDATKVREEIDTLLGEDNHSVTLFGGREVGVRKVRMREVGKVSEFLEVAMASLGVETMSGAITVDLNNPQTLIGLFTNCYDDVVSLVSSLTSLSEEEFKDLDLDDGLAVMGGVWSLNKDFFTKRVLQRLPELLGDRAKVFQEIAEQKS